MSTYFWLWLASLVFFGFCLHQWWRAFERMNDRYEAEIQAMYDRDLLRVTRPDLLVVDDRKFMCLTDKDQAVLDSLLGKGYPFIEAWAGMLALRSN